MNWLVENSGTIIVGVILIAVIICVISHMIKNKKKGISACGCNCNCCPAGGACHKCEVRSAGEKDRGPYPSPLTGIEK